MKIILKHIVKNVYEKKWRTTIMLVTILLSTMVLFIGLSLNEIINNTYSTMAKGVHGDGNILVTKEVSEENPFYHAEDIETGPVFIDEQLQMINAAGVSEYIGENVQVAVTGLDIDAASNMNMIHLINSAKGFTLNGEQAIISSRTASNYNLEVGSELEVEVNNDTYTYFIGAISESNGIFYSEMDDVMLVVSRDQVNEVYGTEDIVTTTLLKVDTEKLDTSLTVLSDYNPSFSVKQTDPLDSVMRDEETFQTTMMVAIAIIVMISAYVILSLAKVIVLERMPVVGTFRSVGATKRMINRLLSVEFLFYGIIGSVIGLILGLLLLPVAADSFNEYKEYGVETVVQYNVVYLLSALAFGTIFPMFIGMFHIYRANKKPLKEIMLNTTHTAQERSKIAVIIGSFLLVSSIVVHMVNVQDKLLLALISVLFLFISIVLLMPTLLNIISKLVNRLLRPIPNGELKLGIKNIANNKTASNNASMIIIVFLLLLMIGVTSTGLDQYIGKTIQQDFDVIINDTEMDFSKYEDIETIDGVSEVFQQYISPAQYNIHGNQGNFVVYGVEDIETFDQFYGGTTLFDDSKSNLANIENGVLIDPYQAERYNLEIGDTILLEPLDKEFQPLEDAALLELEVAGMLDTSSLTTNKDIVIVPLPYFQDHFIGSFNQIEVKAVEGMHAVTIKQNIESHYLYAGMQVQTFEELLASQKATVDTIIDGVLLIILLGLVIGLLGISNNLLVSFVQRKKEYAVLSSVCMSKGQLMKMLLYEMTMTFLAVIIIGLAGGLVMNKLWSRLLYAIGLRIDFSFNFELFFLLSGAVLMLLALSTIFIVRKVTRLNVLNELRYE